MGRSQVHRDECAIDLSDLVVFSEDRILLGIRVGFLIEELRRIMVLQKFRHFGEDIISSNSYMKVNKILNKFRNNNY